MVDLKGSAVSYNVDTNVGPGTQGVVGSMMDGLLNYSQR